jgi:hypothetical protein
MQLMERIEMKEGKEMFIYTEEQLMARLKFFIGICLALTLTGIVFVVLYSLIFVTQPMNAIAPIDQKFFELIIPIATFLTGTLSGIMLAGGDKEAKMKALEAATRPTPVSPAPNTTNVSGPGFSASYNNAGLNASANIGGNSFSFSSPTPNFGMVRDEPMVPPPPPMRSSTGKLMPPPQIDEEL